MSINHPLAAYLTEAWSNTMKKLQYVFMSLAAMLLATPAFAQGLEATHRHLSGFRWLPVWAWPLRPVSAVLVRVRRLPRRPRLWRVTRALVLESSSS